MSDFLQAALGVTLIVAAVLAIPGFCFIIMRLIGGRNGY